MLNNGAWRNVQQIMKVGSFMKFVPYVWDSRTRRFLQAPRWHLVLFYFHFATALFMGIFSAVRLALALSRTDPPAVPNRIKTMTTLWTLVYSLEIVCFVQFLLNRDQIRFYANSLFAYIEKSHEQPGGQAGEQEIQSYKRGSIVQHEMDDQEEPEWESPVTPATKMTPARPGRDWISLFVRISTLLLIANPPSHSIMLSDNPCAPHFLSSLFLECKATDDKSQPILHKLPFVLIENFTISTVFYMLTFNWTMIFVGLAWIKTELEKSKIQREASENDKIMATMERIPANYRYIQMISILMNSCFRLYLTWFPSILLGIVAFLVFAIIRFWHLDFRSYMMFPLCGFRCCFETFTPLTLAGYVSNECGRRLRGWKEAVAQVDKSLSNMDDRRWIQRFHRSCRFVQCSSGSLYAFENSIVLVTICNCSILTCNLLIMFKVSQD